MIPFKQKYTVLLNHLPGLVILVFGMTALYYSLVLIQSHNRFANMYKEDGIAILSFQNVFDDFEMAYEKFEKNSSKKNKEVLKNEFDALNDSFANLQGKQLGHSDEFVFEKYNQSLSVIQAWIKSFLKEVVAIDRDDYVLTKEQGMALHEELHDINEIVRALQGDLFNSAESAMASNARKQKEQLLYWSVLAMGFAGFLLMVLNSHKLISLENLNREKKEALDDLSTKLAALEMARDGILITDSSGAILYVNGSLLDIVGVDRNKKTSVGEHSIKSLINTSNYEVLEEDIFPDLDKNGFWLGDFTLYHEDGKIVDTELSLTRLPDGGLVGTFQDISEKKKAEGERKSLEDQFYQAQKMEAIGRLAGGIAHDFNNILAAMNGYAEFLVDDLEEAPEQQKFAHNILQAGMQARGLVDQMLAFSRRSNTEQKTMDLVASVEETVSMLQATVPKTIEIIDNLFLPYAPINGNTTQISQLIMNLGVNAQDAMEDEHGKIIIELEGLQAEDIKVSDVLQDTLPDGQSTPYLKIEDMETAGAARLVLGHAARGNAYVRLRVKDSGSGMSRTVMEHIFEPFFTTKTVDKGTGLGLATVHGVIVSHQGMMVIESVLEKGTSFDLYFPLSQSERTAGERGAAIKKSEQEEQKSCRVLLVEDQENVREMTIKMLERMGYEASFVQSGLEGLDHIRENPTLYDVVITDHNMPKMTGLEMVQQVHLDLPEIPFILLSGYSEQKMQGIIDNHPAIKGVLRKPVSKTVLSDTIEDVLKKSA